MNIKWEADFSSWYSFRTLVSGLWGEQEGSPVLGLDLSRISRVWSKTENPKVVLCLGSWKFFKAPVIEQQGCLKPINSGEARGCLGGARSCAKFPAEGALTFFFLYFKDFQIELLWQKAIQINSDLYV